MSWTRREAMVVGASGLLATAAEAKGSSRMYGLISEITAAPGKRDELADILIRGAGRMPGCLSYVVAGDPSKTDALWVTEVWKDEASHAASLKLPEVAEAMQKGRPLIAGFDSRVQTIPFGGAGLSGS